MGAVAATRSLEIIVLLAAALLAVSGAAAATDLGPFPASHDDRTPRPPIVVTSDSMFNLANGVREGSGTADDPYVISGWAIDGKLWAPADPVRPTSLFPPGIFIQGTDSHVIVEDNHVLDNPRAQIWLRDAENVTVRDNVLERTSEAPRRAPHDDVVTLEDVANVTVEDNLMRAAGSPNGTNGVIVANEEAGEMTVEDVVIDGNVIRNEGSYEGTFHGIFARGVSGLEIRRNDLENTGDVDTYQAVDAVFVEDLVVEANEAAGAGPANESEGIRVTDATRGRVAENILRGQDLGILGRGNLRLTYEGNDLSDHPEAGIRLEETGSLFLKNDDPIELRNNTVDGAGTGLVLEAAEGVRATGNALRNTSHGISLLGPSPVHYDHDVDTSNTVEGKPVRYHNDPDVDTIDGTKEAGFLAVVGGVDLRLEGTPPDLPANGQGLVVAGGRNVTVANASLSGHGTSLKVVGGPDHAVRNLSGTDAVLRGTNRINVTNATLEGSDGTGLTLEQGALGATVEDVTLRGHAGLGLAVHRGDGTEARRLLVEQNAGGGIQVVETDDARVADSSIAGNDGYGLNATDLVLTPTVVDATENWWGCPDGPDAPACDDVESGDNAQVAYDPWLTSEPAGAGDDS